MACKFNEYILWPVFQFFKIDLFFEKVFVTFYGCILKANIQGQGQA